MLEKTWFMGCQFQTSGVFTKFLSVATDLNFQTLQPIISMEKAILTGTRLLPFSPGFSSKVWVMVGEIYFKFYLQVGKNVNADAQKLVLISWMTSALQT